MKDIVFFPAAAVLAGLMVLMAMVSDPRAAKLGALSVGEGRRDLVAVQGLGLKRITETRRDTVTLIRNPDQPPIAKITSRRNFDLPTAAKDVAHLPIAPDLEVAFSQKNVKVKITARRAPINGSPEMRVQFSAGTDGDSGWQTFLMTPEWQDYSFAYTPPQSAQNLEFDYLAIWADPDGLGRGVEVSQIVLDARG